MRNHINVHVAWLIWDKICIMQEPICCSQVSCVRCHLEVISHYGYWATFAVLHFATHI